MIPRTAGMPFLLAVAFGALGACDRGGPSPSAHLEPATSAAPSGEAAPAASAPPAASSAVVASTASSAAASAAPAAAPTLPRAEPLPVRGAAASASAKAGRKEAIADAGARASTDAGPPPSPGLVLAREIDAVFAAKPTYTARFEQHYLAKIAGVTKDSSGKLFVQRPDKISFRYDAPNENRIVCDGTTVKVYMAEDKQMIETPIQKTQYPGALGFLLGNGIASSFEFTLKESRASGPPFPRTVLQGKPLVPNPSYETVVFVVNQALVTSHDPGAIEGVTVIDVQGNRNRFNFKDASQPASIPPSEFTFTPPPGTTLVH